MRTAIKEPDQVLNATPRWQARGLRRLFAGAVATLAMAVSGQAVFPQPIGPIKMVIPVPPGGSLDLLARLLADQIGRTRQQTIVMEYRPGANSVIGTEAVARATPDGRTLLINAPAPFVIIPHLQKLGYDPVASFVPICNLVSFPEAIVVNSASPYRTLGDLLGAARQRPGELTMASIGPASLVQIAFEMLKRAAGIDMTFVPYAGTAPAVNALLGGHVTSYIGNYRDTAEHIEAGKLRALATASPRRVAPLPDVPTIAESGFKVEQEGWFGLFAPGGTPKETISRLEDWFTAALQAPEVGERLAAQGLYPVHLCGADFAASIRRQFEDYGRIIREANITLQ
jgi:tripartite-type tricarboxylate transporter receptor subunit TctC